MPIINLKQQYPHLPDDLFMELPDAIIEVYEASRRKESSTMRKRRRYKAQYTLDLGDHTEYHAVVHSPSPEENWLQKVKHDQLYDALQHLSELQSRRVYAFYILGIKKKDIALKEGVTSGCICETINRGLKNIKQYYDEHFEKENEE